MKTYALDLERQRKIDEMELLDETIMKIKERKIYNILHVQQTVLRLVDDFMYKKGILRVMPLMLAPITDTLNHSVEECDLFYQGQKFDVMKSMIFHKQLTLMNEYIKGIYIVSPNIRLERAERGDDRHLFEFTQVDFEFKEGTREKVLTFMEELLTYVFGEIKELCKDDFESLGIDTSHLDISTPFKRYDTVDLKEKYGEDFEKIASKKATQPFWLLNHKREFYDAEDLDKRGTYRNYDLIWPLGFGEGLSGGEREYTYERILTRMREIGTDEVAFRNYIEIAKRGELVKSAGAGFGVERITRFICKQSEVDEVTLFSRKPGKEKYIF